MKTHARKKATRSHGRGMGTSGHGSRKQHRSSGNRGGRGMSGTGKRADQKKTLITKIYGHGYFGKSGFTSNGSERDKRDRINLRQIESNLDNYIKNGVAKKTPEGYELNLEGYKILGDGEIKIKLIIKAGSASEGAMKKVAKAGGKIIVEEKKEIKTPIVENPKKAAKKPESKK